MSEAKPDRAEIERELAFFRAPPAHALTPEGRGRRHRLRRGRGGQQDPGDPAHEALGHALADRQDGQAVLTFRALIESARFDRAWKASSVATDTPANDNINPCAVIAIAA